MKNLSMKTRFTMIANEYLVEFCKKHGFDVQIEWASDEPGTTAIVGDFFIDFDVIRYDIDNDVSVEKFEKWYWKALDVYELTEENYLSYKAFCSGAPDKWTDSHLAKIKELRKNVENAKNELIKCIKKAQD